MCCLYQLLENNVYLFSFGWIYLVLFYFAAKEYHLRGLYQSIVCIILLILELKSENYCYRINYFKDVFIYSSCRNISFSACAVFIQHLFHCKVIRIWSQRDHTSYMFLDSHVVGQVWTVPYKVSWSSPEVITKHRIKSKPWVPPGLANKAK